MRAELWSKTQSGRLERRVVPPATRGSIGAEKRKEAGGSTIGSGGASWAVGIDLGESTSRKRRGLALVRGGEEARLLVVTGDRRLVFALPFVFSVLGGVVRRAAKSRKDAAGGQAESQPERGSRKERSKHVHARVINSIGHTYTYARRK
jgi:hypothetical protein